MLRKLADILFRNWVLKLMALILAILLWLVVQVARPEYSESSDHQGYHAEPPYPVVPATLDSP